MQRQKQIVASADRVRELLEYEPETGVFRWKCRRGRVAAGSVAGSPVVRGYRAISVDNVLYRAHRLAFVLMEGRWPEGDVDHIDGDVSNNRYSNLREASRSQNMQNQRRALSNNKSSGLLGASWHKQTRRWQARITLGGKDRFLGRFDTAEAAHAAYLAAKRQIHSYCTI